MTGVDRSEATRRQLCLAAEALVATEGLAPVTLRRIALVAGQRNTAAVSYHFGSIGRLLRAVVDMRLADTETHRQAMIARRGGEVAALDAFGAWLCLARPLLMLSDERAPHAHIRFLTHMSTAGLLSDPFDASIARPGAPSIGLLLDCLHRLLEPLPPAIGRARIALCGMMFWNAVALYDQGTLGAGDEAIGLDRLLADVERHVQRILADGAQSR